MKKISHNVIAFLVSMREEFIFLLGISDLELKFCDELGICWWGTWDLGVNFVATEVWWGNQNNSNKIVGKNFKISRKVHRIKFAIIF